MEILDDYCMDKLKDKLDSLASEYKEYKELLSELDETDMDEASRLREQSLLEFEVGEITDAEIVLHEDEELEQKYHKMINSKKIAEAVNSASSLISSGEWDEGALDSIGKAVREISSVVSYDKELEGLLEQLSDVENLLSDFNHALSGFSGM